MTPVQLPEVPAHSNLHKSGMLKGITPLFGGWEPQTYYAVEVAFNKANPVHHAILYSGFLSRDGKPGSYSKLLHPGWESSANVSDVYYIRAIRKIGDDNLNPIGDQQWLSTRAS